VQDRFGDSGAPWELVKEFEVSAEHIAQKAAKLMKERAQHSEPALAGHR
jgi:transketolase